MAERFPFNIFLIKMDIIFKKGRYLCKSNTRKVFRVSIFAYLPLDLLDGRRGGIVLV